MIFIILKKTFFSHKVQRLAEEKRLLEESFTEVVQEKAVVHTEHQTTVTKMSVLENELLSLKQQVRISLIYKKARFSLKVQPKLHLISRLEKLQFADSEFYLHFSQMF